MIDMKIIGTKIKMERKKQMITVEQLAEKAGVANDILVEIEKGERIPSLPTMDNIACALNVSIDFLKGDIEYKFIKNIIEINNLNESNRQKFIDFISENIKYFK